jgi:hypothetical protein
MTLPRTSDSFEGSAKDALRWLQAESPWWQRALVRIIRWARFR